ncbi:MAG: hypothetical protein EHM89_15845, partial [Acidobacteria bacterium]
MTEEAFRAFYERTSRSVWAYLSRLTGDTHLADDLLQETFYRFLRANGSYESEAHRRNGLEHRGLCVLSLQQRGGVAARVALPMTSRRRVRTREFLVFNQELATLLKA